MKKLHLIQSALKAPKSNYNSFGKYSYRSCEDILEAVKPILNSAKCSIIISDEIVMVGDRIYVKATATIISSEDGDSCQVSAYAREALDKKGMDDAQITGSASSYARKYALNGLLACDDNKDADYDASQVKSEVKAVAKEVKIDAPKPAAIVSKPVPKIVSVDTKELISSLTTHCTGMNTYQKKAFLKKHFDLESLQDIIKDKDQAYINEMVKYLNVECVSEKQTVLTTEDIEF